MDALQEYKSLPRCNDVFERGVFHPFTTDEDRSLFAQAIAELLDAGELWVSVSGIVASRGDAMAAAGR